MEESCITLQASWGTCGALVARPRIHHHVEQWRRYFANPPFSPIHCSTPGRKISQPIVSVFRMPLKPSLSCNTQGRRLAAARREQGSKPRVPAL
eukprot:2544672-Rhodomonas_salina.4